MTRLKYTERRSKISEIKGKKIKERDDEFDKEWIEDKEISVFLKIRKIKSERKQRKYVNLREKRKEWRQRIW